MNATAASSKLENDEYMEMDILELLEDPKIQAIITKISNESGRKGASDAFNMLREESKGEHDAEKQTPTKTGKNLWSSTKNWLVNHKKALFVIIGLAATGAIIYSLKPGSHAHEDGLDLLGEQADMSEAMNEL